MRDKREKMLDLMVLLNLLPFCFELLGHWRLPDYTFVALAPGDKVEGRTDPNVLLHH